MKTRLLTFANRYRYLCYADTGDGIECPVKTVQDEHDPEACNACCAWFHVLDGKAYCKEHCIGELRAAEEE